MTHRRLEAVARLIIIGGSDLAVDVTRFAKKKGYDILVITSFRQEAEMMADGVAFRDAIRALGVTCHMVERIDSEKVRVLIGDMTNSVALSLGAAWVFSERTISEIFGNKLFNLHPGALPVNRGGGGFSWQILMGSRVGHGVCHRIDGGVDTGEIVFHHEFLFPPQCVTPDNCWSVYRSELLVALDANIEKLFLSNSSVKMPAQPEYLSTYWPRINTQQQAWIDWTWDLGKLARFICAFDEPYWGAQSRWSETDVRIKKVQADYSKMNAHPFQFGMVYRNNGRWLSVAANGGTLVVERVLDALGRDLLNEIKVGDRFYTEFAYLERRNSRVFYRPSGIVST